MTNGSPSPELSRRGYLSAAAGVTLASSLAGCAGASASGELDLRAVGTSEPIQGLESCELTIVGLWLMTADSMPESPGIEGSGPVTQEAADVSSSQDRRSLRFGDPKRIELLQDSDQSVETLQINVGPYEFLQFQIAGIEATASDGSSAAVGAPTRIGTTSVVQFDHAFEIQAGETTEFVAGVQPVPTDGRYILQPVADTTVVR